MVYRLLSLVSKLKWINDMIFGRKEGTFSIEVHPDQVKGWRWKNFTPQELACKGNGLIYIDAPSMDALQKFRELVGVPVIVNSAYRSPAHNKAIGGALNSMHLYGKAFDIRITPQLSRTHIHTYAKQAGFTGFGDYNTFVHVDTGAPRYWDDRKV